MSGPSGAGKGTLIDAVRPRFSEIRVAVSATTRTRRPGDIDGREYHFLTDEEFERRVVNGEFAEHVRYAGSRYGTLRSEVDRHLDAGSSVLIEIELEGARALRGRVGDPLFVFIEPPSYNELERRLRHRGTDSEGEIARRLAAGRIEMAARGEFDYRIVNEDADVAAEELARVIDTETRA